MIGSGDDRAPARRGRPLGDLTTTALGIGDRPAQMAFRARDAMVPAGLDIAARLVAAAGGTAELHGRDGAPAAPGDLLLTATGSAGALHRAWKSAQTLVEIASGIASATAAVAQAAAAVDPKVRVACTRKTVPGARSCHSGGAPAGSCTGTGCRNHSDLRRARASCPIRFASAAAQAAGGEDNRRRGAQYRRAIAAAAADFTRCSSRNSPRAVAAVAAAYRGHGAAIATTGGISPTMPPPSGAGCYHLLALHGARTRGTSARPDRTAGSPAAQHSARRRPARPYGAAASAPEAAGGPVASDFTLSDRGLPCSLTMPPARRPMAAPAGATASTPMCGTIGDRRRAEAERRRGDHGDQLDMSALVDIWPPGSR
jgi:molybdenum transport protein